MDKKGLLGLVIIMTYEDYESRMAHEFEVSRSPDMRIKDRHRAIFVYLSRFGTTRSVDLAKAVGIRPQSMMKLVHELEDMGLITRRTDPADARSKLIEMTPAGRRLEKQFAASTNRVWAQYADILGERKLEQVVKSLAMLSGLGDELKTR